MLWQVGVGVHHQEVDCLLEEWEDIKVIGFEPHPKIYANAVKEYPGELYNLAVCDVVGQTLLYSKPNHKDGSSILPAYKESDNAKPVTVGTTKLDQPYWLDLIGEESQILLWLDCEGSEISVLNGAKSFIHKVAAINVEMTGVSMGRGWALPESVHCSLVRHGFYLQLTHTNRIMGGQYDAFYVRGEHFNPSYCNCVPEVVRYLGA